MKKCNICHVMKDESEFITEKGKVVKRCKRCRKWMKDYYIEHREAELKRVKAHNVKHREERLQYQKMWYEQNREKNLQQKKERYKKNHVEWLQRTREYNSCPAKYSTYLDKLTILEDPIEGENGEILVRCAKCHQYFSPTNRQIKSRIWALTSDDGRESRMYCSESCKHSCEVFNKKFDPAERASKFERDPTWSKEIKARAGYACERCGAADNLEAHHEIPIKISPSRAKDEDNGICLCQGCHRLAHAESGCTFADLKKL